MAADSVSSILARRGKRVAYQVDDGKESSIWIYELSGPSAPRRLTLPGTGANRYPVWSSDGKRVTFQSDREGDLGIFWQLADGSAAAERLTKPEKEIGHVPDSWSPDGQTLSFTEQKKRRRERLDVFVARQENHTVCRISWLACGQIGVFAGRSLGSLPGG
jgi:Tol biopolymer transport system component